MRSTRKAKPAPAPEVLLPRFRVELDTAAYGWLVVAVATNEVNANMDYSYWRKHTRESAGLKVVEVLSASLHLTRREWRPGDGEKVYRWDSEKAQARVRAARGED